MSAASIAAEVEGVGVGMGIDKNLTILIPLSILLIDLIPYRFSLGDQYAMAC